MGITDLTVIERALYCDIVHVCVRHSGHLSLLNRGDTTFWVEDKDGDVGLVSQSIDGSAG